jgi:hypothetical protein
MVLYHDEYLDPVEEWFRDVQALYARGIALNLIKRPEETVFNDEPSLTWEEYNKLTPEEKSAYGLKRAVRLITETPEQRRVRQERERQMMEETP